MDSKIASYIEQSREVIAAQQKEINGLQTKLAEANDLDKTAADAEAELVAFKTAAEEATEATQKEASERAQATAEYLRREGVIAPGQCEKFASDLADAEKAHNLICNLASKLASSEAAPAIGKVDGAEKTAAEVKPEAESADAAYTRMLRQASGVQ